jgi:uncharacterized membrane protein YdfJ with MMPL/SSD domain
MSIIFTKSLIKQLEQITHQLVSKPAQKQNEQQVQSTGNKLMNAPKSDETQRRESNEQYENATKLVMLKNLAELSTTH